MIHSNSDYHMFKNKTKFNEIFDIKKKNFFNIIDYRFKLLYAIGMCIYYNFYYNCYC